MPRRRAHIAPSVIRLFDEFEGFFSTGNLDSRERARVRQSGIRLLEDLGSLYRLRRSGSIQHLSNLQPASNIGRRLSWIPTKPERAALVAVARGGGGVYVTVDGLTLIRKGRLAREGITALRPVEFERALGRDLTSSAAS